MKYLGMAFVAHLLVATSSHSAVPVCEKEFHASWWDVALVKRAQPAALTLADVARPRVRGYDICVVITRSGDVGGYPGHNSRQSQLTRQQGALPERANRAAERGAMNSVESLNDVDFVLRRRGKQFLAS